MTNRQIERNFEIKSELCKTQMKLVNINPLATKIPYSHIIFFIRIIIKIASTVESYRMIVMHYEKCLWHMVTTLLKLQFM